MGSSIRQLTEDHMILLVLFVLLVILFLVIQD